MNRQRSNSRWDAQPLTLRDLLWQTQGLGRPAIYTAPGTLGELRVPYSDDRELIGDILRFGPDVQVISPQGLRQKVQQKLLAAVGRYVD